MAMAVVPAEEFCQAAAERNQNPPKHRRWVPPQDQRKAYYRTECFWCGKPMGRVPA
ncbi:MAG: hypothetical protein KGI38_11365 [Thaumarchaeota archaeon]|nr:hypothetical protein [Nitrososphaerota archaeon]